MSPERIDFITTLVGHSDLSDSQLVAELRECLERARVVGVLDAWAGQSIQFAWEYMMAMSRGEWMCRLWKGSAIVRSFAGHSADAARAAAAKAIEAGEV